MQVHNHVDITLANWWLFFPINCSLGVIFNTHSNSCNNTTIDSSTCILKEHLFKTLKMQSNNSKSKYVILKKNVERLIIYGNQSTKRWKIMIHTPYFIKWTKKEKVKPTILKSTLLIFKVKCLWKLVK